LCHHEVLILKNPTALILLRYTKKNENMKYPWKRFWCSRDGVMNLSDGGFLYDPDSEYANYVKSDVVSFEKIADQPCLALLGEPGIGKSTVMGELRESLAEPIESSGDSLFYLNLNEYGDESRLIKDIFHCEMFTTWIKGNHILYLFLDSLDESQIKIQQVGTILSNHFQGVSKHLIRLRLRIACRTADWPSTLEQSLPQLWGKDSFGAYELCPLRKKDVEETLRIEGIDAEKFMTEVERTESVALAFKPVTLRFLVSVFENEGGFPSTRTELYEKGCKLLCKELNLNRLELRTAGGAGILSAEERLNVASRIAAISIFCRKPNIFTGITIETLNTEQISVSDLEGVETISATNKWRVPEAHIRETLGTGLFSSRGADLMGFSHQTYAEFLASRYLHLHETPVKMIFSLLQHSGDLESQIVPQLYETAAWIASRNKDVFSQIARNEPHILLRCDEGALLPEQRAELTESYLETIDKGLTNLRDWSLYHHYHKLSHPCIHDQLAPWITDGTKNWDARHAAIDIAETCNVTSLQSILIDLALNENEAEYLRSNAVHAISVIGDPKTRMCLRPLILEETSKDPEDQLKGNALRALWPNLITAEELFGNLTLPKRRNFFGAYLNFVEHELSRHLEASHLPNALKWLELHAECCGLGFPFHRLADDIIIISWKQMDDPYVLDALASTSINLLEHHQNLVAEGDKLSENSSLFADVTKRRKLAKAMVEKGLKPENTFTIVGGWNSPRLLGDADFEWSVQELICSASQPMETTWASLVWTLFRWAEPSGWMLDMFMDARAKSDLLKKESADFFTPLALDSEQAQKMREQYEQSKIWQQKKEPKLLEWLPKDRIQHRLNQFEEGNKDAWWILLREITLEDTSEKYEHLFDPDIRKLLGWVNSDLNTRNRILNAAEIYLCSKSSFNKERLLDGSADEQDIAGYKAFLLLLNERSENLVNLSEDVWAYWTPIFFGPFGYNGDREIQKILISIDYEKVPQTVVECLKEIIRHEIGKGDRFISVLELVENIWDPRIANAIFSMLEEAQAKPLCWGRILNVLLIHGDEDARLLAESKLSLPFPKIENDRSIVFQTALVLMSSRDDAAWPMIWPILQGEEGFGRELIKEFAYEINHNPNEFVSKLTEDSVADLFIWLVRQFPYDQDPQYDDAHFSSKDDTARELRTRLINYLEKVGTPASCHAIQRIVQTLTKLTWLNVVLIEARKNTLKLTWRPLNPQEFLEITSEPDSILVRNAKELHEVIISSLGALEGKLQGENATRDLWDQSDRANFRPIDENDFSNWIKRNIEPELQERGIVVAREVEIRRGEKTDIHVTAIVPGLAVETYDQVRVIIEVKGCWHRELKEAMKTQLVDRYLKDNNCNHGIYLVGWYVCDKWDEDDQRKANTPKLPLHEARQFFDEQAQELSSNVLTIRAVVLNTALR
jgi:hypothetical protein